jgi:hypothetical protein
MSNILAIILAAGIAITPDPSHLKFAARGPGAASCSQFSENYVKNPLLTETLSFTWAQGFLSALNVDRGQTSNMRDLSGDVEAQKSHLRQYCEKHPSEIYSVAVLELYNSLPVLHTED